MRVEKERREGVRVEKGVREEKERESREKESREGVQVEKECE